MESGKSTETVKAHGAMLLFAAIISGSFSLGDLAAPHIAPAALNGVRFTFACLIMLTAGLAIHGKPPILATGYWRFFVLGGLSAAYFVTMFVALQIAEPVSTGAVFTLIPLMSTGFGWLLLKQTVGLRLWTGLLLAACGALWVIFEGNLDAMRRFRIGEGELIYLVGCIAYAAYAPLVRKLNKGEAAYPFTFMTLLGCTLITIVAGMGDLAATNWMELPGIVWVAIVYLAIFATACTFFLLQYASLRLPSSKVLSYGYLIPGFVILYEGLLGHGWAGWSMVAGAALAALALVYALLSRE